MAQEDSLEPHSVRALGVAVLTAGVVFGLPSAWGDENPALEAPTPRLAGRWKLNPELSEDARAKMREAREAWPGDGSGGGRGGASGAGGGERGWGRGGHGGGGMGRGRGAGRSGANGGDPQVAMREVFEAPAEFTITPTASEVVILEKDGRLRALHADGKKYKAEGGTGEVETRWDGRQLVVDTKSERGAHVTETFDAAPDGSRLTVTLKVDGSRRPSVTVKRVYDPAEAVTAP